MKVGQVFLQVSRVSTNEPFVIIFRYMLLLPEGQTGEARETSKEDRCLEVGEHRTKSTCISNFNRIDSCHLLFMVCCFFS